MTSQNMMKELAYRTRLIEDIHIIADAVMPYERITKGEHLIKVICKVFAVMYLLPIPKNNDMTIPLEDMATTDLEYLHDTLDHIYANTKVNAL